MSNRDIDDDFDDDNFDEDEDAKLADESEHSGRGRNNSLEKRRLIDNLLAEKRLARELKDDFDDDDFDDEFDDWDEDWEDED